MRLRGLVRSIAAPVFDRLVAAARQADRAEVEQLRGDLARLRSDVEAELALIRAEGAAREG